VPDVVAARSALSAVAAKSTLAASSVGTVPAASSVRTVRAAVAAGTALVAVAAMSLDATVALVRDAGRVGAAATRQDELIRALEDAGLTRLYSEYWTCGRLSYATRERIACAVVSDDLHRGLDRYRPLADAVRAAPDPGYAFPAGSVVDTAFVEHLRERHLGYRVTDAAGYHLYRVPGGAGVPLPDPPSSRPN
jgi:hypothetical protein